MDVPNAVKRSACDRCRSKRVRCPRPGNSTAPCPRCVHAGAQCVTGSAGHPGRPRKVRYVDGSTPQGSTLAVGASSPGQWPTPHHTPHAGSDLNGVDVNTVLTATDSTECGQIGSASGFTLLNLVGDMEATTPFHSTEPLPEDFWTTLNLPLAEENVTEPTYHVEPSSQSQHQALFSAPDNADFWFTSLASSEKLPPCPSSFLDPDSIHSNPAITKDVSIGTRLMQVKDKMEKGIEAMGTFFSDPRRMGEDCKEEVAVSMGPTNPVAVFLECINEFLGTIQSLSVITTHVSTHNHHWVVKADAAPFGTQPSSPSSETTLLLLSCYLALMRLCDCLFHGVCHAFSKMESESFKSVKVKAVFRIGGFTSLQDITAKSYAMGIIDVIQGQIQHVERCLGLPAAYSLSGEDLSSSEVPTLDMFASQDRAQLLRAVMEQEDVKTHRGNKSCVQSIRENIKKAAAFFGDQ